MKVYINCCRLRLLIHNLLELESHARHAAHKRAASITERARRRDINPPAANEAEKRKAETRRKSRLIFFTNMRPIFLSIQEKNWERKWYSAVSYLYWKEHKSCSVRMRSTMGVLIRDN